MRLETARNTKEIWDNKLNKVIEKRLPTTTVWVFGTVNQLDKFEKYIEEYFPNSNSQVREEDGKQSADDKIKLYSDFYTIDYEDIKYFKYLYKRFKEVL